jgi:hypothetical protein
MVTNVPASHSYINGTGQNAATRRGAIGGFAAALGYSF